MPEPGTVCDISSQIFGGEKMADYHELFGEDRMVMQAWDQLMTKFRVPPAGLWF